ncbi:MAG: Superkiller protein 3 [Bogoriella megaspora]|nr:MAG: Superkiller protein 3 [Bogoriella megaspora]
MSGSKAALKAAKAALDAGKYDEAVTQAQVALASDSDNYFAKLFLGRALDKKGNSEEAVKTYESATKIKPNDDQAWLGLRTLYEGQGSRKVDQFRHVSMRLAEIYMDLDDKHRCQTTVDKSTSFAKEHGTRAQYKQALELLLPTSPLYSYLEGRIPHPSHTYHTLADLTEIEEKERINKEIGERRTRIGARVGQVTLDVKREVFANSQLDQLYQNIIEWSDNDEVRREYEERLLKRTYEELTVLPKDMKKAKRDELMKQAHGMVIIKHPYQLAWNLELEWKDFENIEELDAGVLREYTDFFPNSGLAKVLKGFLDTELSPFPKPPNENSRSNEDQDEETQTILNAEERLVLMTDGLQDVEDSVLGHRLMADYFLHIEEYQSAVDTARKGLKILANESSKSGLSFQENADAYNSTLGTALTHYESPKNHPEARTIFDTILERKATFTPALIGLGLIFEEEEEFAQAVDFLNQALERNPSNERIAAEAAWCKTRTGDVQEGLTELEGQLPQMKTDNPRSRDLRALTLYRIGVCQWEMNVSKGARKDRKGAYAQFLAAIKMNTNFAPAYTSLGIYYADYARDKKRARQCFQKAFELSSSELVAAEQLARSFADQGEWDIVEIIAQRAIDSGKIRLSPGSKKKPVSWPYSALGVVQMNKQEYSKSVASFLAALRLNPSDYNSYVGLGESYHNSGRYNSASKTFHFAEELAQRTEGQLADERWFTQYMLANVNRELGNYDEAIDGYQSVLKTRQKEFGVLVALLQTLNERAWHSVELGFFGQAEKSAREAIDIVAVIVEDRPDAFNLWKALGDACSIFANVQAHVEEAPLAKIKELLQHGANPDTYNVLVDVDGIGYEQLENLAQMYAQTHDAWLNECLQASILAQKRAIHASSHDTHAQAVAWYNLGWTEYYAHTCLDTSENTSRDKQISKYLKATLRCFKRAIELEAGNSEFWNALGVVTTQLNPKVAQHSFVRSLHLNERSARTWTNLGALYLLQSDLELAHNAFARAQSTDPDYAHAWLGEGLLALLWGDSNEGLSHFTHAFEISDSSSLVAKRQYAVSTFDHLLSASLGTNKIVDLIQPLFALQQLLVQSPSELPYKHLAALYFERIGHYTAAIDALTAVCLTAESDYEDSESPESLSHFSRAKSDLARNQLAGRDFKAAAENVEMALDLSSEADASGLDAVARRKLRLSAHLTAGLAYYYDDSTDQAIEMFRSALEESDGAADVVCTLAEVLWAKGGEDEKGVAREQLFDCVEKHPDHVGAKVLLGAIAASDEDEDVMIAAKEDLETARTLPDLDTKQQRRIEDVLAAIALMLTSADEDTTNEQVQGEITTSIMLSPSQPHGWMELAAVTDEAYPAQMALKTAVRAVPPHGPLDAEDLAKAYAGSGTIGDAQRAISMAPWLKEGWGSFGSVIA